MDLDTGQIAARIKAVEKQLKRMQDTVSRMDRKGGGINDTFKKLDNRMGKLGRTVKGVMGLFTKLLTTMAKFGFLAMAGELAIFTAGLLAIKLALITGRAAASLYQVALKGLSVTAASAATALSVAAAAMRQFQEAQLSPFLGGGRQGRALVGRGGRGFGATTAGLLGGEGAGQVSAALARAGFREGSAVGLAQNLGAMTNYDPKAMMQIISALGGAKKGGGLSPAISAITSAVGFKPNTNISASNVQGLVGLINSGSLTSSAFAGQGGHLGSSFIGTAKTSFTGLKDMFADMGGDMLEPMRQSFLDIANILRENFLSLQTIIQKFGADSMGPTMVTIFDRMMKFITNNIIDHLDNIKEMGENFVGFFKAVKNFFVAMGDWLGKYEPAANVIIDMFKAASGANKSSLFSNFSKGLTDNADKIKEFGAGMGRLFGGIFSIFDSGNRGFFGGIDRIVGITDTIVEKLIPALVNFFSSASPIMERLPTIIEGLASALHMIAPVIHILATVLGSLVGALGAISGGSGPVSALLGFGGMAYMANGGMTGLMGRGGGGVMASLTGQGGALNGWRNMYAQDGSRLMQDGWPTKMSLHSMKGGGTPRFLQPRTRMGRKWAGQNTRMGRLQRARVGPMAGVMGGVMAAGGIMGAFNEGGGASNVMNGAIGGAMLGASIGSVVPLFGTAAGAIGGAVIGGGLSYAAGLWGKNKKQKASERLVEAVMGADYSANVGAGKSRRAKFNTQSDLLELWNDALASGDGDSEAMAVFMRAQGLNPDDYHRDDYFEKLKGEGFGKKVKTGLDDMLRKERQNEVKAIRQVNNVLGQFGSHLTIGADAVGEFISGVLGRDLMDMSTGQLQAAALMMTADQMNFSRNNAIIPDIGNSGLAIAERSASASAALNAIIGGDMTSATITDFLTKQAGYEISLGNNADVAGMSGILELQAHMDAGRFGAVGSDSYNKMAGVIKAGSDDWYSKISAQTFTEEGTIRNMVRMGGLGTVDKYLTGLQEQRAAVSGTAGMDFQKRLGVLSDSGFEFTEESFNKFKDSAGIAKGIEWTNNEEVIQKLMTVYGDNKNIDQDAYNDALSQAFVDAGLGGGELLKIEKAIKDLPNNLQSWDIFLNNGADGGGQSMEFVSSGGDRYLMNFDDGSGGLGADS